ncbi:MAG TPA: phage holin family protein [Candidatus Limnocylindria bacterium]
MDDRSDRPLGELFGDLGRQVGSLVRRELDLARVEATERAGRFGRDAAMVAIGGAVLHGALLVLLAAAVLVLIQLGLDPWLAAVIVAVVVGIVGALVLRGGIAAMREASARPSPTAESMRENVEWAKEQAK